MINEYKTERNKLRSMLNEDIWDMLEATGAIIAGGTITSLFTNKEINDLDIYFPSMEAVISATAICFNNQDFIQYESQWAEVNPFTMHCIGSTDKSILFRWAEQDIQFMHFKYFSHAWEIFDTFDFTCCMGAYDVAEDRFILHDDFLKHNAQRYLKYNPKTAFPLISALRVNKYIDKGFTISRPEMLRVGISCCALEIENWEEAASQCGGMYGYCVGEAFDISKDFSLEELMEQLTNIESNPKVFEVKDKTFGELLSDIDVGFVPTEGYTSKQSYSWRNEKGYAEVMDKWRVEHDD